MTQLRSKRLAPLLEIARQREREAARELGLAQKSLQEIQLKIDELQHHKLEYKTRFNREGQQGIQNQQLRAFMRFLSNVDNVIEQRARETPRYQTLIDEKLKLWRARNTRYQGLKKLIDRYIKEERLARDRLEQIENDDRPPSKPLGA